MADASSLLWRINLKGADVGNRWPILADFWRGFGGKRITSFGDMHRMMALASVDVQEARKELQAMKDFAHTNSPFEQDQQGAYRGMVVTTDRLHSDFLGFSSCRT